MPLVSFDLFKAHARANDFDGDDALLRQHMDAAEGYVLRAIGRSEIELEDMGGGQIPAQIKQAVLIMGAYFYDDREGNKASTFAAVSALISPYTNLMA